MINKKVITALKQVMAIEKKVMDFFFDAVDQYTSPRNTLVDINHFIALIKKLPKDIIDKYNDYPFEVYRGTQIAKSKYDKILNGSSLKIKPSSWSKDEDEAIKFARGWTDPKTYSLLITKKIKNSDILLDLEAMADDGFFEGTSVDVDRILSESEIMLNGITVTKNNIKIIDRDDDAEYAQGSSQYSIKSDKTIDGLELKLFSWGDVEKPISEDQVNSAFTIRAYRNGKEVGYAQVYREDLWYVYEVSVEQAYRRQGIATLLYDYAEEVTGRTVYPQVLDGNINDPEISGDAFLFWNKRNPSLVKDILDAVTDSNRKDLIKLI